MAAIHQAKLMVNYFIRRLKGYALGGYNGSVLLDEIQGLDFSTESSINPSAALSVALHDTAGVSSRISGYCMGGERYDAAILNLIDSFIFSSETHSSISATLASARYKPAGAYSPYKGYAMGGNSTRSDLPTINAEIDGIIFNSNTAINPSASLSVAVVYAIGMQSSIKGYNCGGQNNSGAIINTIDSLLFSTEAVSLLSASLPTVVASTGACCGLTEGYILGGYSGSYITEIQGVNFSTDTAVNPSASLVNSQNAGSGVSNLATSGYILGGGNATIPNLNIIGKFDYITQTSSQLSATISVGLQQSVGIEG